METETVTLFLGLLAVVAQLSVLVAVVLAVGGRWSATLAGWRRQAASVVGPYGVALAALVAAVCTAGSLYLSEGAGFRPCRLCWYQRYAMYPLVVVLAVAASARSRAARLLGIVVAVVGGGVSLFHMLVERYPGLEGTSCDPDNPCSLIWVEELGYLTIPTMALSGFALIVTLLLVAGARHRPAPDRNDP